MTRRLLRTITVTIIVTESWTLVWNEAAPDEPPTIRCYTQHVSSRSTSAATVAHFAQEPAGYADCAGSSDAGRTGRTARPNLRPTV